MEERDIDKVRDVRKTVHSMALRLLLSLFAGYALIAFVFFFFIDAPFKETSFVAVAAPIYFWPATLVVAFLSFLGLSAIAQHAD